MLEEITKNWLVDIYYKNNDSSRAIIRTNSMEEAEAFVDYWLGTNEERRDTVAKFVIREIVIVNSRTVYEALFHIYHFDYHQRPDFTITRWRA